MELTFDDFRKRASDSSLSKWEKIGFPDSYRKDYEKNIFNDISTKLRLDSSNVNKILDIGCGCGDLVQYIIQFSETHNKSLVLVDSQEMLSNVSCENSKSSKIQFISGYFPAINLNQDKFDAIIVYSVIQYVFLEQSIYSFIHKCIDLLNPGGRLLLGDIPNLSMRERFLNSEDGKSFKKIERHESSERIDDSIIFSILQRFRGFNCETYLLPQASNLPMQNRREDILIVKR